MKFMLMFLITLAVPAMLCATDYTSLKTIRWEDTQTISSDRTEDKQSDGSVLIQVTTDYVRMVVEASSCGAHVVRSECYEIRGQVTYTLSKSKTGRITSLDIKREESCPRKLRRV